MPHVEMLEKGRLDAPQFDVAEKMEQLNHQYRTKLTPENGIYGITEQIRDDGVAIRTGKNESGHTYREYFRDNHLLKRRESIGNKTVAATYYDDNGTAYLCEKMQCSADHSASISRQLSPNTTIVKGNFTAITDAYGRPIVNKVTDAKINKNPRPNISRYRGESYSSNDHIGHIIAHEYGGPSSTENLVPQLDKVNLRQMRKLENEIHRLIEAGHTVDYEMHSNYDSVKSMRPSSFEPKITVDGKEYTELPPELKKIYNRGEVSSSEKLKISMGEKLAVPHDIGKKTGLVAAGLTLTVSTVENVSAFIDGEITGEEMAADIVKDTVTAGALGYATGFVTTAVSQAMSHSSSALIRIVGGSCLPAAVVSFGVEACDSVLDYAQGKIDAEELAYDLGESASSVAGGMAGGMAGAAIGSVAGPVGTAAGRIIGGVVGCVVASEAYQSAVEIGTECIDVLGEKVETLAQETTEFFQETVPDQLDNVKDAFNHFFEDTGLPFNL